MGGKVTYIHAEGYNEVKPFLKKHSHFLAPAVSKVFFQFYTFAEAISSIMTKVEMEKDITGKYENILPSEGAYSTKNNLQTCNLTVKPF